MLDPSRPSEAAAGAPARSAAGAAGPAACRASAAGGAPRTGPRTVAPKSGALVDRRRRERERRRGRRRRSARDAFGRVRSSRVSLALEASFDAPASKRDRLGAEASAFLVGGALVPCAHVGALGLCALASVSALAASGADHAATVLGALGARVASELPLSPTLALRVHGDLVAPLRRVTLRLDGASSWTAPAAFLHLGAGLTYRF